MGKNLLGNIEQYEDIVAFERIKHHSNKAKDKRTKVDHRKNYIDFTEVN